MSMTNEILKNLGPLAALIGEWEGVYGHDLAPSDDRGTETNLYHEKMTFEPILPVDNHEQKLFGLRYATTIRRLNETMAFHEEVGYWLWDPNRECVMKCFSIPRGMSLMAGGSVQPLATEWSLQATLGSSTFGICSNPFLDDEFKTMSYDLKLKWLDPDQFRYEQDTQLMIKGQNQIFHHIDSNTLTRVIK